MVTMKGLTPFQRDIVRKLQAGYRFRLAFSPVNGKFVDAVVMSDPDAGVIGRIHWWHFQRLLNKGIVALDGRDIDQSNELRLANQRG